MHTHEFTIYYHIDNALLNVNNSNKIFRLFIYFVSSSFSRIARRQRGICISSHALLPLPGARVMLLSPNERTIHVVPVLIRRQHHSTMGFMAWSQDPDVATYCHSITILLILMRYPHSLRLFARVLEALFSNKIKRILAMLSGRCPPPNVMERLC